MIDFDWQVPKSGYEWRRLKPYDGSKKSARFLTEVLPPGMSEPGRVYPVFKETGLFKTFSHVAPDEPSVAAFANQYGHLGGDLINVPVKKPLAEKNHTDLGGGERLEAWCREINQLRHLIELEEFSQHGEKRELGKYLKWVHGPRGTPREREIHYRGPHFPGEQWPKTLVIESAKFTSGDLIEPAKEVVRKLVSEKLKEHGSVPQLLWDRSGRTPTRRLRFVPKSLIAAIWLQFALAIEGNRQYQQCEQCNKWFEVAAEKREDARFCRNACRFKAYRRRIDEARKLHAEGMALEDIAAKMGSEVETVKGWVSK